MNFGLNQKLTVLITNKQKQLSNRSKSMKLILKTSFLLVLFTSLTFAQTGTRLVDFNAKSIGRGGTSIGTFDSPALMMNNPAGISFLSNFMLDANISLMFPKIHFTNTLNDADGDKNMFPLPALGYVNKYPESDFTWGVGFFTAGGMGADLKLMHALYRDQTGNSVLQEYHSQLASMQGGISAAYKFTENLSLGVSLHGVYSMLEFWMPYSLDPSIMKGIAMPGMTFGQLFAAPPTAGGFGYDEVTASAKMSDLTAIGFNGKVGLAYQCNDLFSLGLSYTMPTPLTYKNGKAKMDMTYQFNDAFAKAIQGYKMLNPSATDAQAQAAVMAQFDGMRIDLTKGVAADYDLNLDLTFPQSVGFGISYKPSASLNLALDVEWINWKSAFDNMTIKLSNGANPNINKMLGNTGTFDLEFPLNWKNSFVVKVGGEYMVNHDLTFRLGFAHGTNPVPEETVFPVFPAIVENHLMVGGSYKIAKPLTLHFAYEMALNNSLTASKPSLIANEYDGSTSKLGTSIGHLAISYNF